MPEEQQTPGAPPGTSQQAEAKQAPDATGDDRDLRLATQAARNVFPAHETGLIADIVARDLPYYDATISAETFNRMHAFALDMGLVTQPASYEQVVATQFRHLWTG